ncbi:MAG TPA: Tn3 family transposase [Solirubrobacteraceae bacterium]
MIATARANAHRHVELLLAAQLAPERRRQLDTLLDAADGQTSGVAELRRRGSRTGVKELLGQVQTYGRLVALGASDIDISALAPARRRALEVLGRRMTAQQLRRLEPARRHPLMLVLLHALVIERGDELLDQFGKLLRLTDGRARRRVDEQRRKTARQRDELSARPPALADLARMRCDRRARHGPRSRRGRLGAAACRGRGQALAECCTLSYRQLAWATEWYLGDEQLQAANDVLVDYLHQLQLAAHWGTGRFSSSDGQRSPRPADGRPARTRWPASSGFAAAC